MRENGNLLSAMYSRPDGKDGRKSKMFYVVHDDLSIQHALGWDCGGVYESNKGFWWFPSLGYSTSRVHETHSAARCEQEARIQAEQTRLNSLR